VTRAIATTGCDNVAGFSLGFAAGVVVCLLVLTVAMRAVDDLTDE